jgi:hypothetical protein
MTKPVYQIIGQLGGQGHASWQEFANCDEEFAPDEPTPCAQAVEAMENRIRELRTAIEEADRRTAAGK